MFENILAAISAIYESKTQKLLLTAVATSALLSALSALVFGFQADGADKSFALVYPYNMIVFILLITSWLPILLLLYILRTKEAEDLYSFARDQMIGDWTASYDLRNGERVVPLAFRPAINCAIAVNPVNKKLEFNFRIRDNPVYEDCNQTIQCVAIRHEELNEYMAMYYYKDERPIQFDVARHIRPDAQHPKPNAICLEIFGVLNFKVPTGRGRVTEMSGEWFDLNGNITKLHAVIDAFRSCPAAEQEHFSQSLSEIDIHQGNFSANMGRIDFVRGNA